MKLSNKQFMGHAASHLGLALLTLAPAALGAESYSQTILADNPLAYYRLEESVGEATAIDSSSTGAFPGIYVSPNGVVPKLEQPGIDINSAYFQSYKDEFGTRQHSYVEVPYAAELNPQGPFSVEAWVRPMSAGTDDEYRSPLGSFEGWGAVDYPGWFFYQSPEAGGNPSVWIWVMKGGGIWVQASAVNKQQWQHLAAVYDGANVSFYINGALAGSANASGFIATSTRSLFIGSLPTGDYPFDGNVDEVAIFGTALSAEQIQNHYQVGLVNFRAAEVPPEIAKDPSAATVFVGYQAKFTVVADGTQPLSYQWYQGNTPIDGATNDTLTFTAAAADNNKTYKVTVKNAFGSVSSAEALLTISTDLTITLQPAPISRSAGSMAAFRVAAEGAKPISFQWFKGASPIDGATGDTLWLSNLALADDATVYHAKVSNPWTSHASDDATLAVVPRAVDVPITGYARIIKAEGPVAYWRLNESDGSPFAVDAAGSFDGSYDPEEGSFGYQVPTGIPGETDPAVSVTGKARVAVPFALELNPQGPFAAEAWVKPNTLGADSQDYRTVFSSLGSGPTGWLLYQQPNHTFAWVLFGNSWSVTAWLSDTQDILQANTWYHVVLQHDGSVFSMYVNGNLAVSQEWSAYYVANKDGKSNFGWRSDNDWKPFDGVIDEVAFYNKPLTPAQISSHYQASVRINIAKQGGNTVLSWPFGTLQEADHVLGPFRDISSAQSPFNITTSGSAKFYRVKL